MKITNKLGLPKPIYNAVASDYEYKEKQFSATAILQGLKSLILQKRHNNEIEVDVADMANLIFGLALHKVLEDSKEDDNEIKEAYLKQELPNGYKISGRFDIYNADEKAVKDYKTCSVYKLKFNNFDDWKKQLHIYAWLVKNLGFEVKNSEIVYFIKDWSARDYKLAKLKNEYYPEKQIGIKKFTFNDEDYKAIETYIVNRFNQIEEYEKLSDDEIPVCTDEERFYTGDKFAVKKKGNIRALRVFDTEKEANEFIGDNKDLIIEFRKGENRKCEDYCNACEFCNFYKENVRGDN